MLYELVPRWADVHDQLELTGIGSGREKFADRNVNAAQNRQPRPGD